MSIFDRFRKPPKRKENPVWPAVVSLTGATPFLWTPKNYATLSEAGYENVAAVYGCVSLIAKSAGAIEWYVMSGENEVLTHPLLTLLQRPNEFASRARFIQDVVSYLLLSGNSYVLRVGGSANTAPRFIYTLRPDRMRVKPDARNLVGAYIYDVGGQSRTFPVEEILHLTEFHPTDDFYGLSRLEVAAKSIDIANLSMEWNANLLHRDMRIPGAIKVDGTLTDDQRKVLQSDLAKYQGAENAGKIPIFEGGTGGMEWQPMAITPKDMDWLNSEKYNLRRICSIFNVASELLGDSENKTYSNLKEARAALYMEAVLPMMDLLKDELNAWLSPLFGGNVTLEYDRDSIEAIQEDRAQKYTYIQQADWLTINEKREATGYDDIGPMGDVVLTSFSRIPLDQIFRTVYIQPNMTDEGETIEKEPEPVPEALKPTAGKPPVDEEDIEEEKPKKSAVVPIKRKSFWRDPERKSLLWKAFDRRLAMQERQFSPLVKKYLLAQADRVKARLKEGAAPHNLIDVEAEVKAYSERFFPFYERAFKYAGQAGLRATQGKFWEPADEAKAEEPGFVVDPDMLKKLRAQIAKSAHLFNETTGDYVKTFIEDAAVNNLTTEQVTQELWKALGDRAAWEARRIAATEMTRTDGWGSVEGYKQNETIDMKGWNCQLLENSRKPHVEADGQEVGVDEDFLVGGEAMAWPGDDRASAGNVCNCRCSTYPVVGSL
jgi:HK97 family phage portal protein